MNNENDLNAALSKFMKREMPAIHTLKVADKITLGISDFLMFGPAPSVGIETKFIKELPVRDSSKALKHEFHGAQLTFLESLILSGNRGYGLIGIKEWDQMILIEREYLKANYIMGELRTASNFATIFRLGDFESLIRLLFPEVRA